MKTVLTIIGIRPDIVRLAFLIKRLDSNPFLNHVVLSTGQHFDDELTEIIYKDLDLRRPDYQLEMGARGRPYNEQVASLFETLPPVLALIDPDFVITLGDTNSVLCNFILRREASRLDFKIARIEAGMRVHSFALPEEGNRKIADCVADYFFCYTKGNKANLIKEGKNPDNIFIVGNTIKEPCEYFINKYALFSQEKKESYILADIHREENLTIDRLTWILRELQFLSAKYRKPVKLLNYKRTISFMMMNKIDFSFCELEDLKNYSDYLHLQFHSFFTFSDSGSAAEECPLIWTKLIVPREETERPESVESKCCVHIKREEGLVSWQRERQKRKIFEYLENYDPDINWIGDGNTSRRIAAKIDTLVNE